MALTTLKMVVLAPMPRARQSTATSVKPGLLTRMRTAKRKSCAKVSMGRRSPPTEITREEQRRFQEKEGKGHKGPQGLQGPKTPETTVTGETGASRPCSPCSPLCPC